MVQKKRFHDWINVKEDIHFHAPKRSFSEGEIWWIANGENVGVEINGKGPNFARPAIIFKKLGARSCFVIPLTSQRHIGTWYATFQFGKKSEYAALAQAKVIGVERLYRRMGKLSKSDYIKVMVALHELLFTAN